MPQMAPLNWLTLFIYFLFIFFFINIINFYNFFYLTKDKIISKKKIEFNWKW